MKTKIEIEIPDGYEFVRYRFVHPNDWFIGRHGKAEQAPNYESLVIHFVEVPE